MARYLVNVFLEDGYGADVRFLTAEKDHDSLPARISFRSFKLHIDETGVPMLSGVADSNASKLSCSDLPAVVIADGAVGSLALHGRRSA